MSKTTGINLNLASNMFGAMSGETRAQLVAAIERPCEETWEDAHSILLRWEMPSLTLWQAVREIDPSFRTVCGPVDQWINDRRRKLGGYSKRISGWERTPDTETIIQAINYATH